ncbi:hypothetical protein CF336_g2855, partial [Tilletia laevis]
LKENVFEKKYAEVLIAEDSSTSPPKPIGWAIYFFTYSTWTGKPSLYLEDLPSIAFYEKTLGATRMEEWRQMRLDEDGIKRLETLGL